MLKRGRGLIAKVLLLTMCTTFVSTAIIFAEKNVTSSIKLTGSATTVSNESDFEFDSETGTITSYKVKEAEGTKLVIPSTINGVAVKHIGNFTFANHYNLAEVIIPDGVTSIGFGAFADTHNLKSIKIPSSVTSIGGCAFFRSGIESITIPEGVKKIEIKTFGYCGSLKNITIPTSIISIEDYAFQECKSLKSLSMPNSVKTIGGFAFDNCTSLTSITIPSSITALPSYGFSDCTSLTNIIIPDSITWIQHGTLDGCSSLKSITIPSSVTRIDDGAFQGYNGVFNVTDEMIKQQIINSGVEESRIILKRNNSVYVTKIELNKTKTNISKGESEVLTAKILPANAENKEVNWSSGDINVATVDKNGSITGIKQGETAITCIAKDGSGIKATCIVTVTDIMDELDFGFDVVTGTITSYSGPDGVLVIPGAIQGVPVKHIGERAFSNCSNSQIIIPSTVSSVEDYAFLNCKNLIEIIIPSSITVIKNRAFMSCINLKEIIIPESVTTLGEAVFLDCSSLISVKILGNIKEIPSNTFNMCESLKDITIPSSVTSIGYSVFGNCISLKSITIPSSVTNIAQDAFQYFDGIFYVNDKETKQRIIDSGVDSSRIIINKNKTKKVKNIELNRKILSLIKGKSTTLTALVTPSNASNKEVIWKSSNITVATVDKKGEVRATGSGVAIITCTAKDGSGKFDVCNVIVMNKKIFGDYETHLFLKK